MSCHLISLGGGGNDTFVNIHGVGEGEAGKEGLILDRVLLS